MTDCSYCAPCDFQEPPMERIDPDGRAPCSFCGHHDCFDYLTDRREAGRRYAEATEARCTEGGVP